MYVTILLYRVNLPETRERRGPVLTSSIFTAIRIGQDLA